jgi:hypothetical protein
MIILSIFFWILAASCNSIMDTLQFRYNNSFWSKFNPHFWNPKLSWRNKWGKNLSTPKFWGSTTFLVFLTDGWHLFQFLMITFAAIAVVTFEDSFNLGVIINLIIYKIIWSSTFELLFRSKT